MTTGPSPDGPRPHEPWCNRQHTGHCVDGPSLDAARSASHDDDDGRLQTAVAQSLAVAGLTTPGRRTAFLTALASRGYTVVPAASPDDDLASALRGMKVETVTPVDAAFNAGLESAATWIASLPAVSTEPSDRLR